MRLLGIDFGRSRIGVAVVESEFGVSTARPFLPASGTLAKDAEEITKIATKEEASKVVFGLPSEDPNDKAAKIIRRLASIVEGNGLDVEFVNESMTSFESEAAMLESGLKGSERRARVDGESACRILERYLNKE